MRLGFSLIELLISIAIVAVLIGLSLSGVQIARAEAVRLQSKNKLRQILLATHNYAGANDGRLPGYGWFANNTNGNGTFVWILPFLEGDRAEIRNPFSNMGIRYVPAYVSPADLSFSNPYMMPYEDTYEPFAGDHSYPANWQAIRTGFTFAASFPDGASSTIGFAERYARCGKTAVWWIWPGCHEHDTDRCLAPYQRRATFADADYDDVLPVTANGATRPSTQGRTFEVVPTFDGCDYRVPQTPHRSGMLTGYLDGSVRSTRAGVAPEVFWAAVTPAGGEVVADGW